MVSSLEEEADAPSILVALITYVTVTVEPTLSSADPLIVTGSIANSYFSVPFCTASVLPVAATTVPVISYVFPPAANNAPFSVRLAAVSKQIIFGFINRDKPRRATTQISAAAFLDRISRIFWI